MAKQIRRGQRPSSAERNERGGGKKRKKEVELRWFAAKFSRKSSDRCGGEADGRKSPLAAVGEGWRRKVRRVNQCLVYLSLIAEVCVCVRACSSLILRLRVNLYSCFRLLAGRQNKESFISALGRRAAPSEQILLRPWDDLERRYCQPSLRPPLPSCLPPNVIGSAARRPGAQKMCRDSVKDMSKLLVWNSELKYQQ